MQRGALLALVVVAVSAGGCGGGSHTASSTVPANATASTASTASNAAASRPPGSDPGLRQFIAEADPICRRLDSELAAAEPKSLALAEVARLAPRRAALELAAVTGLGRLAVPAAIARDWRQIVAYRRTLADELLELGQKAKANDAAAIDGLAASKKRVHERLLATASRDGFKYCSRVL